MMRPRPLVQRERSRRTAGLVTALLALSLPCIGPRVAAADSTQIGNVTAIVSSAIAAPLTAEAWLRTRTTDANSAWQDDFERTIDAETWAARSARLRAYLIEAIGGLPSARTDLNARMQGVRTMAGYRIECIRYESQPGFVVTANLYLPAAASSSHRVPAVLIPCGHAEVAKAWHEYQAAAALLALNGIAALVYDPVDQGERMQRIDAAGEVITEGVSAHMQAGMAALLLGQNLARTMVWDGMRGIDYLYTRPEIDPGRLGVTGHSGGGTLTCFLFALDPRVQVAAPCCYGGQARSLWSSWGDAVDSEQYLFGQLANGFEYPDFFLCRPPAPVLLLAATQDNVPIKPFWQAFRELKRAFTSQGSSERIELVEDDVPHSYSQKHREGMVEWMLRWLNREERSVREPDIKILSATELFATPEGQVMRLPGARSIWDIYRDEAKSLAEARGNPSGDELRRRIRLATGINDRPAAQHADPKKVSASSKAGYTQQDVTLTRSDRPVPVGLTLLRFTPSADDVPVLLVTAQSRAELLESPPEYLDALFASRRTVALCRPFGTGDTAEAPEVVGEAADGLGIAAWLALYELGESALRHRTEDVMLAARHLIESGLAPDGRVDLWAEGATAIPALHAAVLAQDWFRHVTLRRAPESWHEIFTLERSYEMEENYMHGVLRHYDIPDLAAELGDRLTRAEPVNLLNLPAGGNEASTDPAFNEASRPGLVGVLYGSGDLRNPRAVRVLKDSEGSWGNRGASWSAEWHGFFLGPIDGDVTFEGTTNRSIEVRIGDQVMRQDLSQAATAHAVVSVRAGQVVPVTIRFHQSEGDDGTFALRWSWLGQTPHIIPESHLRHSPRQWTAAQQLVRR